MVRWQLNQWLAGSLAVALVLVGAVALAPAAPARADAAGLGGDFVPLASAALLDTRSGTGGTSGLRGAQSTTTFQVLGVGGVPSTGVRAVLVDLEAIRPTVATYLTVWPDGTPRPAVSMVNVPVNQTMSNSAIVPVTSSGRLSVFNLSGNTHVAVDVQGYFTAPSGGLGGGFVPTQHTRIVDTRSGLGTTTGSIPAGGSRTVTLTGGVIPTGAASTFVDLIVTGATAPGHLRVGPGGSAGARSVIEYIAGTTTHAVSVQLSASGQATFSNNGTGAVHLVLTAQGYTTTSSASGAGLRTVTATRLLDTRANGAAAIPAGGEVDLQIGGTNGLPTRAIAGTALNLTAVTPSGIGYLTAWPLGDSTNPTSMTTFGGLSSRAGLGFVRVGDEGKVRIKNVSNGTVHILVDLQGWFADPLPAVPVIPNTPVRILQLAPPAGATLGTVEYAFTDNLGRLRYGHQPDPNLFGSVQWSPLSPGDVFSGPPALGQLSDGRVQIVGQGTDSNYRSISRVSVENPGWNSTVQLGGSMAAPPATGRLASGVTVLFGVDADGRLWHYRQEGASPAWRSLGDADLTGGITVGPAQDGLRIVAIGTDGAAKTAFYHESGSLSSWVDLGGTGFTGTPAMEVLPGYRARIVIRGEDGLLVTKYQGPTGTWPAAWETLGDLTVVGSPDIILDPLYARLAVVARGVDNRVYAIWETAVASGTWGFWADTDLGTVVTDPTAAEYTSSNGPAWIVAGVDLNSQVKVAIRSAPASAGRSAAEEPSFRPEALPKSTE